MFDKAPEAGKDLWRRLMNALRPMYRRNVDSGSAPRDRAFSSAWRRWAFDFRPPGDRRFRFALIVSVAAPVLITAVGLLIPYPRIAIPALLYLLGMVGAISLGGLVPGLVAAVISTIGLSFFFLPPYESLSLQNLGEGVFILLLFLAVAAAFASALARAQREQWLAEEAEEHLRAVVESAPLAFILVDPDARVRLWSPGAEQIFGWTAEEVLGDTLPTVPEGRWGDFRQDLARQISGESHRGSELRARRKEGGEFDVGLWTVPFRDRDGRIVGSLGVVADLSETKRLEEALRQSQKLESIGKLAGGIAHDFNNVLAIIRAQYEVALARLEEEHPLRKDLDQVRQVVDQASGLTRQLLAFSRKQLLEPTPLDINAVILQAEAILRTMMGEHIELETDLDPDVPTILADRTQIEHVLLNLAANARDGMPQGGRFGVETRAIELGPTDVSDRPGLIAGRYAEITVFDSGHGMPVGVQAQAFEPFFTTKGEEGTGLGLATVYGVIRQSNGAITIGSEPGEGTRFTILLPETSEAARAQAAEPAPSTPPVPAPVSSGRILLVEDDGLLRRFVEEMLELAGFTVLTASDGEEALDVFTQRSDPVDVLLTDVVMPRMSGTQLAERIREIDEHVQVVYTSGYAKDAPSDGNGLAGSVLPKPFTTEQLVAAVTSALNRRLATSLGRSASPAGGTR